MNNGMMRQCDRVGDVAHDDVPDSFTQNLFHGRVRSLLLTKKSTAKPYYNGMTGACAETRASAIVQLHLCRFLSINVQMLPSLYQQTISGAPPLRIGLLLDTTALERCFVEVIQHILDSKFARI